MTAWLSAMNQFASAAGLLKRLEDVPGGRRQLSIYSPNMDYRYAFARWWQESSPVVLWIGFNPGIGDTEVRRRPTLERMESRSRDLNMGGLLIGNIFAARSKSAKELPTENPVGPFNDAALRVLGSLAAYTVVAWGNVRPRYAERAAAVTALLSSPQCLGVTRAGYPIHPLYVAHDVPLRPWTSG